MIHPPRLQNEITTECGNAISIYGLDHCWSLTTTEIRFPLSKKHVNPITRKGKKKEENPGLKQYRDFFFDFFTPSCYVNNAPLSFQSPVVSYYVFPRIFFFNTVKSPLTLMMVFEWFRLIKNIQHEHVWEENVKMKRTICFFSYTETEKKWIKQNHTKIFFFL